MKRRQSKHMRILREKLHYWQGMYRMELWGLKNTKETILRITGQMREEKENESKAKKIVR